MTSLSLLRYHTNDYSVPTEYGHRQVLIKGYVDKVVICAGSEEIARHRRSYGREELIFQRIARSVWRSSFSILSSMPLGRDDAGIRVALQHQADSHD